MRRLLSAAALLALATSTVAVTLNDFTPRVSNLPNACNTVYMQTINGCQASDFQTSCSKSCVLALNSLTAEVQLGCGNAGITGSNIIVEFLEGNGPSSLCGDAGLYLSSSSSSAASTSSTSSSVSTKAASTSSVATSSSATSSTVLSTATVTASSSMTSSSGVIAVTTSTQSSTGTSTVHKSSQTNTNDSGGGSPFDNEGTTYSGGVTVCASSMAITVLTTILALAFSLR